MILLIGIISFIVLFGGGAWMKNVVRVRPRPSVVEVITRADGFTITDRQRKESISIACAAIRKVTVITPAKGPYNDKRFFHIVHDGGEVTAPARAKGAEAFVAGLKALPGFDATAWERSETAPVNSFVVVVEK